MWEKATRWQYWPPPFIFKAQFGVMSEHVPKGDCLGMSGKGIWKIGERDR